MKYVQSPLKAFNASLIEASLRYDEEIACRNATVITDKDGNVTAWFSNDVPIVLLQEDA